MNLTQHMREEFEADHFATGQGIQIDRVEEEETVCSVLLEERHMNAHGVVQGGLVYTLADFAFAVAANAAAPGSVTLNGTMHFTRAVSAGRLTATVTRQSQSRAVSVYEVAVKDDEGRMVALATFTGYRKL